MAAEAADRDFVLLGIKYEAAKVGGLDETSLAGIVNDIQAEVGDSWETDPMILRGRNAVRVEHGLPRIGDPVRPPAPPPARRSMPGRIFGR